MATGYFTYANGESAVRVKGWDLSITAGSGGAIASGTAGKYEAGTEMPVTASPKRGYTFSGWNATGGSLADASAASTIFTMPAGTAAVVASFSIDSTPPDDLCEYTIDPDAGTADVYVDVHSLPGREGETVNVFYVLYKNGRMAGLEARSPILHLNGFDDRVTVNFDPAKAPDTCKVFVLNQGGCDPAIPNL